MAVPKYDEMMLPLLQLLADEQEHHQRDLAAKIGDHFRLSDEERNLMLPSTQSTYLRNRVGWAGFHLRKAGLVELSREATLRILPSGMDILKNPPPKNRPAILNAVRAVREFMNRQKQRGHAAARTRAAAVLQPSTEEDEETPEERMETAFSELRETLVADLLAKLSTINPFRFEQVVLDLLVAMGYGGSRKEAAAVTQKTGDEGIDGVINEDRLGLDVIYVQAKRIQNFVGALAGKKAAKGVFITTSAFHDTAREYAAGLHQKVILIDGQRSAELMIEHGIGVAEEHAYHVKKIDSDYFEEV